MVHLQARDSFYDGVPKLPTYHDSLISTYNEFSFHETFDVWSRCAETIFTDRQGDLALQTTDGFA